MGNIKTVLYCENVIREITSSVLIIMIMNVAYTHNSKLRRCFATYSYLFILTTGHRSTIFVWIIKFVILFSGVGRCQKMVVCGGGGGGAQRHVIYVP